MKQLFAVVVCVLLLAPVLAAEGEPVSGFSAVESRARTGDAEAQLEVGILYEFGYNMQNNKVPALAWYILAAKQGNPQAADRRDVLKKSLSAEQIDEAERLSETLTSATSGTQPKTKTPGAAGTDSKTETPGASTTDTKSDKPKTETKTDTE